MVYEGTSPCKDCKDRVLGCHSTCSKYIDWKATGVNVSQEYFPASMVWYKRRKHRYK